MKFNITQLTFLLFIFFGITSMSGQNNNKLQLDPLELSRQELSAFTSQVGINSSLNKIQTNLNQIYIEQIGERNLSMVSINTSESDIQLIQKGSNNYINLNISTLKVQTNIVQHGNNNYLMDSVFSPDSEISLNLMQKGNDLHFERFGSNSIGDNLQFNMTGNSKTLIIRNFK